jgi:twitching motility protein PilT
LPDIRSLLESAVKKGASDIFIGVKRRVMFKINGVFAAQSDAPLSREDVESVVKTLYALAERPEGRADEIKSDDFSASLSDFARFRINVYRQRSSLAAVIRVVRYSIPGHADINIPDAVMGIADRQNGLVLVTGATGSGKTTTLACIIDRINRTRNCHIITMEEPIEFLHRDDKSIISQREIPVDADSYIAALRDSLRQAPDIILLGEMRDYETIGTAMTAAETGQLVISTLHTTGAANTVDRIIDVFPPNQQQQIRVQLSMNLQTVVSQKLLPGINGGLIPAFEILHGDGAVRSLIRESKTHQIDATIANSAHEGMIGMDAYILKLYKDGKISEKTAVNHAVSPERMAKRVAGQGGLN